MSENLGEYDEVIASLPADRELRFRPWRAQDADAVLGACSQPATQRWIAPLRGYDAAMALDFVAGAPGKWAARQHLRLCLTDATDAVLGSGDLDDLTFTHGRSELGWWISPSARGRGLGVRLGRLLARAGFETLGLRRLTADIVAPNDASRWVAAGAGFRLESTAASSWVGLDGERYDMETWRLLAGEDPLEAQPELTAGALHLRPWRPSDARAVFEICQDPEIQRYTSVPSPYALSDAEGFVGPLALGRWAGSGEPFFAVCDSVSGDVLASVSAFERDRLRWEIGFWCAPAARGAGVVTAACGTLLRWLVATREVSVIEWRALVGNDASRRVAEKLGFSPVGTERRVATDGATEELWLATMLAGEVR